jgi:hypothetical protein
VSCHGDGGICKEIKQLCPLRAREDALEFFRARRDLGRTARASRNLETKFHALELRDALLLISSCNDPDSCKPARLRAPATSSRGRLFLHVRREEKKKGRVRSCGSLHLSRRT